MSYRREVIDPGDEVSKLGAMVCRESRGFSKAVHVIPLPEGRFRGLPRFRWQDQVLVAMIRHEICETPQSDGAGGKPQFFTLVGNAEAFRVLGWEVIAMNNDDIACGGGFPVMITASNLDIKGITKENLRLCEALQEGFLEALRESSTVLMTGETAVMRHSITAFCDVDDPKQLVLTWNASALGLVRQNVYLDGSAITPGMTVVGLLEDGYRCNGGTALTKLVLKKWGPDVRDVMGSREAMEFVAQLTTPSRSYARLLCHLNGWNPDGTVGDPIVPIYGMAHITGGGVWGKFGELLPEGVGAELDLMPKPPSVLLQAQRIAEEVGSPFSNYGLYDTFHGGCGVLLVCDAKDVPTVIEKATDYGHTAQVVGSTVPSDSGEINIESTFRGGGGCSSLLPDEE